MPNFLNKTKKELDQKGEVVIYCKIIPNAPCSEIKDILDDDTIKIAIVAPPEKGKANRELIKFLSKEFGVAKSNISIISGMTTKNKLVKVMV